MSDLKVVEFRREGTPQEALDIVIEDLRAGLIDDIMMVWKAPDGSVYHCGSSMQILSAIGLLEVAKVKLLDEMTVT
jgi:hypothetical protein